MDIIHVQADRVGYTGINFGMWLEESGPIQFYILCSPNHVQPASTSYPRSATSLSC